MMDEAKDDGGENRNEGRQKQEGRGGLNEDAEPEQTRKMDEEEEREGKSHLLVE